MQTLAETVRSQILQGVRVLDRSAPMTVGGDGWAHTELRIFSKVRMRTTQGSAHRNGLLTHVSPWEIQVVLEEGLKEEILGKFDFRAAEATDMSGMVGRICHLVREHHMAVWEQQTVFLLEIGVASARVKESMNGILVRSVLES